MIKRNSLTSEHISLGWAIKQTGKEQETTYVSSVNNSSNKKNSDREGEVKKEFKVSQKKEIKWKGTQ
jgi:hypothetical protein